MKIESLKLVYFSPTGTTKSVIQAIANGINHSSVDLIDFTLPEKREQKLQTAENELLVVGVPVYMGRVPAMAAEWLQTIKAYKTPAICIVVYGNRDYENALIELKDILMNVGCIPIAGAAYIGEHSFSSTETPIAESRPDASDVALAESFGREINVKLESAATLENISIINIPGSYPYGGVTKLWDVNFISVSDDCGQCGVCAEVCPAGAIDPAKSDVIDIVKCITCCACIKSCPQKARSIKPDLVKNASLRLFENFSKRKKTELFL